MCPSCCAIRSQIWRGRAREVEPFLNAHDIMPTLLGVCGLPIPDSVDGRDFSPAIEVESISGESPPRPYKNAHNSEAAHC